MLRQQSPHSFILNKTLQFNRTKIYYKTKTKKKKENHKIFGTMLKNMTTSKKLLSLDNLAIVQILCNSKSNCDEGEREIVKTD